MRKKSLAAILLSIMLLMSLMVFPSSAAVPEEGAQTLDEVTGGNNVLKFPTFIDGGEAWNEETEAAFMLVNYEEEDSKYGSGTLPYWAEWMYDTEYVVNRIILRTANDNEANPRRMGDGWTLSGSNDGKGWTVIYTGKEDDVLNINFTYFYVDLPDNTASYKYYRLNSDEVASDNSGTGIQLTALMLTVDPSVEVPTKAPYVYKPKNLKISADNVVVEATDFDAGTFNETTGFDEGDHVVRPDEAVQTSFCGEEYVGREGVSGEDTGCIGWTAEGEWVQYTVSVIKSGIYQIDAWVASGNEAPGSVEFSLEDTVIGSAQAANNGWQNYSKVTVGTFEVTSGSKVFKATFPTGAINMNAFEFTRVGDIPSNEPETEEDSTVGENNDSDETNAPTTTAGTSSDDEEGSNVIIFVVIAIAVVAVIVVVVIVASKKKK